ncbi:MAG TPA: hypothetical protein VKK61_10065, partial [Tepidisphaeraceae bacterium]|nr:hypothetical protein [Tepidisphaeraceae bacterium]
MRWIALTIPFFCMSLSGCNVIGLAASVVGPPEVKAQYDLAIKPTIVVVKDLPDPNGQSDESEQLAGEIDQQLTAHVPLVPVISSSKVAGIRSGDINNRVLSPAAIGRTASAQQVIYVQIQASSLDAGPVNDMVKGQLSAMVSVIDPITDKILWPSDGTGGVPLFVETPMLRIDDDVNKTTLRANLFR